MNSVVDTSRADFSQSSFSSGPHYIPNPVGLVKNPDIDRKISDGFVVDKTHPDPNPDVNSSNDLSRSEDVSSNTIGAGYTIEEINDFIQKMSAKDWWNSFYELYPNLFSLTPKQIYQLIYYRSVPQDVLESAFGLRDFGGSVADEQKAICDTILYLRKLASLSPQYDLSSGSSSNSSGFLPDVTSNPSVNIENLTSFIDSLLKGNLFNGSGFLNGSDYAQLLLSVRDFLALYINKAGLGSAASHELVEHVADICNSYISAIFTQALNYQSWYLQQEYNSPVNQLNRLSEAGLSSAFIFGNYSNTASSPAGVAGVQQVSPSNAGSIQQQEDAAGKSLFGQIFGAGVTAIGSFVSAGASAVLSLAQAATIKAMRPLEIAKAGSDVVNNAATYEVLRSQANEIGQNILLRNYSSQLQFEQGQQSLLQQRVDTSRNAYDTSLLLGTSEITEQKWETLVKDKDGNVKKVRYTNDELEHVLKRGGKDSHNNIVVGVSSWEAIESAYGEASGGASIPFIGKGEVKVGGSLTGKQSGSSSDTSSRSSESSRETSELRKKLSHDYSEDGSSFHIGESKFTSVVERRRVPLPEHQAYIQRCYDNYLKAIDEYNTYSTGAKARLCHVLDNIIENLSSLGSSAVASNYRKQLDELFKSLRSDDLPVLVGD